LVDVRWPFFSRTPDSSPLQLPLPQALHLAFGVYFALGVETPPTSDSLLELTRDWIRRQPGEMLPEALMELSKRGVLNLEFGPRDMLPTPPPEMVRYMGLDELTERRLEKATHVVGIFCPELPRAPFFGYWLALAAAKATAERYSGAVFDPGMLKVLKATEAEEGLPEDGLVRVARHMMVPQSRGNRGLLWTTTKGLSKFGLPELEIKDAPSDLSTQLMLMINGVAGHLIKQLWEQSIESEPGKLTLVVDREPSITLKDIERAFGEEPSNIHENALGQTRVRLEFHPGKRGHDSFLTILPPSASHEKRGEWLHGACADLFGSADTLRNVSSDSEAMEAAHMEAVSRLPSIRQRFHEGLSIGQILYVKYGFPLPGTDDGHEYMWCVVNTWRGDRLSCTLANDPVNCPDLRPGQNVDLREDQIFDWMLSGPGDHTEGAYTTRVVERDGSEPQS
jgi:uncharacterized protein YegJ (DUF2314 family)